MNTAYVLPKETLDAMRIRGQWHATALPGDPLGRWFLLVEHSDDESRDDVCKGEGVVALPDVLSGEPVGLSVADAVSRASPSAEATDTVAALIAKLRPVWPMAKLRW